MHTHIHTYTLFIIHTNIHATYTHWCLLSLLCQHSTFTSHGNVWLHEDCESVIWSGRWALCSRVDGGAMGGQHAPRRFHLPRAGGSPHSKSLQANNYPPQVQKFAERHKLDECVFHAMLVGMIAGSCVPDEALEVTPWTPSFPQITCNVCGASSSSLAGARCAAAVLASRRVHPQPKSDAATCSKCADISQEEAGQRWFYAAARRVWLP